MSASTSLIPRNNIHTYPLGDESILFDELSNQLFRNNPTAAVIWQGCKAGFSSAEIIAALSRETSSEAEQIANDVNNLISQWRALGLFHNSRKFSAIDRHTASAEQSVNIMDTGGPVPQLPSSSPEYEFKILDTCFRLKVPTKNELRFVIPMLSHLSVSPETRYDVHLSIVYSDGRYLLLHDNKLVDWCARANGIGPMLHGNALVIAYELSHCLMGLHAAAVYYQGKCILIPAPSGSGKSTLTAALLGSGFSHCADDLVLLTAAPVYMRPVPVAVGLKAGSWKVLASYHPKIASLPTHLRSDGKQVRYLVPSADTSVPMVSQSSPIDYIVFPQFVDGENKTILDEISAAEGLYRLAEAGYELQDEMTAESVKQLVDWITNIPCYGLRFNQLDDAVSNIRSLIS